MPFECGIPIQSYETVTLSHGGGGKLTQRLISQILLPSFSNSYLNELHDGAILPSHTGRLAFTTDSFVVSPSFFPGGNIGHLAVHGTTNDLAMCGARPMFLSLALILEEGFLVDELRAIAATIRSACEALDVQVVTGDLKVVERGKGDGIFINTTGLGTVLPEAEISPRRVRAGDRVLISGGIAEHGIAILSLREGLDFETDLKSDTAALWPLVERMLDAGGKGVHVLRDATRGGVASVLNEIAQSSGTGIQIEETQIPVREDVRGACEILGLDPLHVANEGKLVAFVAPGLCETVLDAMRSHPLGTDSAIIGEVVARHPGIVRLKTGLGGSRVLEMMSGEQLPRIC